MISLKQVPYTSGIYLLYENECLLYIGKAKNFRVRLLDHLREHRLSKWYHMLNYYPIDMAFDRITRIELLPMEHQYTKKKEMELILKLKPKLNSQTRQPDKVDEYYKQKQERNSQDVDDYWDDVGSSL